MPCYRVRFFKEVTTDTGTDVDMLQAVFDVNAIDEQRAKELAKQRFCGDRKIRDWHINADRIAAEPFGDGSWPHADGVIVQPIRDDH